MGHAWKHTFWIISICLFAISGCARRSVTSSSNSELRDDLSQVRPRFEYKESVVDDKEETKSKPVENSGKKIVDDKPLYVNKRLQTVLDTISRQNKSIRYINGYRIQIYVGNVRQEADEAKSYVYQSFPDLTPYVSYSQPTYRVKAGDFMYRSDAEQYLEQIKQQYTSAVILSDRVEIRKTLMINPTD